MTALDFWRGDRPRVISDSWSSLSREVDRMFHDMDRFFNLPNLASPSMLTGGEMNFNPAVDTQETEDSYLLSFDIPGIKKNEIDIQLVGNQLVVSGERKQEIDETERGRWNRGRLYGKFQRNFILPEGTQTDRIEARYENGVLELVIPKSEQAKPKKIAIAEGEGGGFFKKLVGKDKDKENLRDKENTRAQTQEYR